jgi:hypothetical protein
MTKIQDLQEIGSKIVDLIIGDEEVADVDKQLDELANRFSFILAYFKTKSSIRGVWTKIVAGWGNDRGSEKIIVSEIFNLKYTCDHPLPPDWKTLLLSLYPECSITIEKLQEIYANSLKLGNNRHLFQNY